MNTRIVRFYEDRLRNASSGALILFYQTLEDKGHKEITVDKVISRTIDAKNMITEIYYAAPYDRKPIEGGGGWHILTKNYVWRCQHANDFSCTSTGVTEIKK